MIEKGLRGGGGTNLVHDVLERVRAVDGEADKDEVRLGVRERPQPVVLLLPGRVPERELHRLAGGRVCRVGDVVLEDGGNVFLRESVPDAWFEV